jgi:hypothetical protein
MLQYLGFCIERAPSLIPDCGTGVFVTKGIAKKGSVIALYPGINKLLKSIVCKYFYIKF